MEIGSWTPFCFDTIFSIPIFEGDLMVTGIIPLFSPRAHRRIDEFTFPGLLAAAAWMTRLDRTAAAVLPLMSFRTHNRVAAAHGALVIAAGLLLPGLSRRGRWALCTLGTCPSPSPP